MLDRPICDICGKAPSIRDDVMCLECARAYRVLFDLLQDYPELRGEDFDRLKTVFEWRMRTARPIPRT